MLAWMLRSAKPVLLQIGHANFSVCPFVCLFGSSLGEVDRLLFEGGDSIKRSVSDEMSRSVLLKYEDMSLDPVGVFLGELDLFVLFEFETVALVRGTFSSP